MSHTTHSHRFHPFQVTGGHSEMKSRSVISVSSSSHSQTYSRRRQDHIPRTQTSNNVHNQKNGNMFSHVSKIGKYLILDRLSGSSLHRAINSETKQEHACRILEMNKYREYVTPYFQINSHPHINKVVEVLVGESFAYVIFEPSYGDLHSYVRSKRRLKEEEASKLFSQIVGAVCHCHDAGLVLRDLKLRKFVFQDKERTSLKLETLDDAHLIRDTEDVLTDKHGCPAYVSPEILESTTGYSGKAADMWSLGVMFYTMILGRYPFHDNEPSALFSKIRSGQFVIPDCISSKAKCLLRSVLRREPVERLSAQELLEHPWFYSEFTSNSLARVEQSKGADQLVPDLSNDDSTSLFS